MCAFRFHGIKANVRKDRPTEDALGVQKDDQGGQQKRYRHYQLSRVSRHDVRIQELCTSIVSTKYNDVYHITVLWSLSQILCKLQYIKRLQCRLHG